MEKCSQLWSERAVTTEKGLEKDLVVAGFEDEDGNMRHRMGVASESWERHRNEFSRTLERIQPRQYAC